jgi:transcriptional regulator
MARGNEQWQHFESNPDILCIFLGPHSYVSPSWYTVKVAVPTWNYASVHVYGKAKLEDDAFLLKVIQDTTIKYESKMPVPWKMELPQDYVAGMMRAIVGFSIQITKVEAKFKLGQGRSKEDQLGTLAGLERSGSLDSLSLANFIKAQGTIPS